MQYIADFHLHSKYSRATSRDMDVEHIANGAKIKGLDLVGTGDFTFEKWLEELKNKLTYNGTGLFEYNNIFFMLTGEVATYFTFENEVKRVHHVIHVPSFEIVEQINEQLSKHGNLASDGRPILKISAAELVEILKGVSDDVLIYPAHAWTPWMSCFGSKSGFNSLEECYQDQIKHIFALETGLSSDPEMNWRLSSLDKFTLLSNSDSHSANPWRLGREANVFELEKLTYKEIVDVICKKDDKRFLFTIETNPSYGKYHYTGHRNCNVSLEPKDAIKLNNICPKCKRKLTIGVLQRVEELADREEGFVLKDAIPFKWLLPLYEIISFVTGTKQLYSRKVIEEQNRLIDRFDNELNILLDVSKEELVKVTNEKIADAILKVREGKAKFEPGYDGNYGKPIFDDKIQVKRSYVDQKSLAEFQP